MFACTACQCMEALTQPTCTNMEGIQGLVGVQDRGALDVCTYIHRRCFTLLVISYEIASPFKGR